MLYSPQKLISSVEFSLSICDEHMHEIKKTDVLRIDMNE